MKYKIVDTNINVVSSIELFKEWKSFETEEEKTDIQMDISYFGQDAYGMEALNMDSMKHCLKNGDSILFANETWTQGRIYGKDEYEISYLVEMMLYSYLLNKNTLLFHSSLIDYQGKGILFLGPSGIGKTTQAKLWNQYKGAHILNGDLVFVKKEEDGFYAYGSPWHGSSPYFENTKVKVELLVTLEQGKENKIKQLSGFQVLNEMMQQVFLPIWYQQTMDESLNCLDSLLETIPVYHLKNQAEEEAVTIVYEILENK